MNDSSGDDIETSAPADRAPQAPLTESGVGDHTDPAPEPHEAASSDAASPEAAVIDLDAIERDLTDVQTALERLNDGSYWTDEVTGDALPDEVLASFPLTRTVASSAAAPSGAIAPSGAASD